jgi:hypothetical protein
MLEILKRGKDFRYIKKKKINKNYHKILYNIKRIVKKIKKIILIYL